jgi:outer membrane cobalamin receptor
MLFLAAALTGALASAGEPEMADVSVREERIHAHDEVSYSPHRIAIERPAADASLGDTLAKLPGVLVRQTSGFGSATTVIAPQALGSGGTAVTIDGIPVVESSGRGVNFSLIPTQLIGAVEHESAFYRAVDPVAAGPAGAAGTINLRTLETQDDLPASKRWAGAVTLGTGNTLEASGAYRGGTRERDWVAGATGFNTRGDFRFTDASSGGITNRANNDAAAAGALAKHRWRYKDGASVELIDLFSNSDRTNPGPLSDPSRQHQKDTFNWLGARAAAPRLLSSRDGAFAAVAGTYSRTGTRGPSSGLGDPAETTDSRSLGGYVQAGYTRQDERSSLSFSVDNRADHLQKDEGLFTRDVLGLNATLAVELGQFRLVPLTRFDSSATLPSAGDGALALIYMPDTRTDLALSYGLTHAYPSITSISGFTNGGFTVLANPDLQVERDSIVALGATRKESAYTLYAGAFYDLIRNRATFSSLSPTTARFVNSSEVSVWGGTLDAQAFPSEPVSLRASLSLMHAWDRATGHEMPYKPRFEGVASASYALAKGAAVTLQEQWVSKRFVSTTGVDAVSPFARTILRFDISVAQGIAFFKIDNLFDAGGFENPGFPYPGRSFWVGYVLGGSGS